MGHVDRIGQSPSWRSKNLGIFLLIVSVAGVIMILIMGRAQLMDFGSSLLNPASNISSSENNIPLQQTERSTGELQSSNTITKSSLASNQANPTSEQSIYDSVSVDGFNRTNFATLVAEPDKYAGLPVFISGKIYDLINLNKPDQDILTLQIHVDSLQSSDANRAIIFYQGNHQSAPSLGIDSCVEVNGFVRGGMQESSSLGKSIVIPAVDSHLIKSIPCIDSSMPAQKSVNLQVTESLNGIVVQALQVQYTSDHTRIELAIQNKGAGGSIFIKDANVLQEGLNHEQLVGVPAFETYQIGNAIEPGQTVQGFIFFDPLSLTSPATFTIDVESPSVSGSIDSTFVFRTT